MRRLIVANCPQPTASSLGIDLQIVPDDRAGALSWLAVAMNTALSGQTDLALVLRDATLEMNPSPLWDAIEWRSSWLVALGPGMVSTQAIGVDFRSCDVLNFTAALKRRAKAHEPARAEKVLAELAAEFGLVASAGTGLFSRQPGAILLGRVDPLAGDAAVV